MNSGVTALAPAVAIPIVALFALCRLLTARSLDSDKINAWPQAVRRSRTPFEFDAKLKSSLDDRFPPRGNAERSAAVLQHCTLNGFG
jgi:hypothetical protein